MKIYIQLTDDSGKRSLSLKPTPLTLGRKPGNDVQVTDSLCSSTHCQIFFEAGSLYIEDLNSKNGTFLNGTKIKKAKFYVNDHITIGKSQISIDNEKIDKNTLDKLTSPTGSSGGIGLEIENPVEVRKRVLNKEIVGDNKKNVDYVKNSKLYEKIGDEPNDNDDVDIDGLMAKANKIDRIFNIFVFCSPYIYLFVTKNENFTYFIKSKDIATIFKTDLIYFVLGSVLALIIFNKINKGMSKGSLGERMAKK